MTATTPPAVLTERAEAEIRRVVAIFEPAFRQIEPKYPEGCCVQACLALQGYLDVHLDMTDRLDDGDWVGTVEHHQGMFDGCVHNWLYAPRLDVIVDPTAGQFLGGPALEILRPEDPRRANYQGGGRIGEA